MVDVSIIIPCYNQDKYIVKALDSVKNQVLSRWECIIIDDGSIDRSKELILNFIANDERYIYVAQSNRGVSAARNIGIELARGHAIQFLDADDVIHSNKLYIQYLQLQNDNNCDISICDYMLCDERSTELNNHSRYLKPYLNLNSPIEDLVLNWETKLSIPIHCFMFKNKFFKQFGIRFDEDLRSHEDWSCWIKIFTLSAGVGYVDKKLATYRISSDSACSNTVMLRKNFLKAINKLKTYYCNDSAISGYLEIKQKSVKHIYRDTYTCYRILKPIIKFYERYVKWRLGS